MLYLLTSEKLSLLVATFFMTTMGRTGLYQNLVVMPGWFSDPPISFARINQNGKREVYFWIPLQIATLVSLAAAIIANWSEPRRATILLCLGCYFTAAAATASYLAPRIIAWGKLDPKGNASFDLTKIGRRWLSLSWMRQVVMLVGEMALLIALGS
ncbi:MAG: hypothetical protein ACRECP_02100 [Methylocella sp.]